MKHRLLLVTVTLSLLLAGCSGSPATQPPATPENSAPPTAIPSQPTSTPLIENASESDFKFYSEDGETFQTFDDVQQAASFIIDKFPKQIETIPAVVERMQKVANYFPSEKTVRASLNKPSEQLDRDDYLFVMEQYRLAHDIMFASTSGDFYDTLKQVCQQTAFNRIISVAEGEATPYAVELTLHTNNTGLRISDNSDAVEGTLDVLPYIGDYRLYSAPNGHDITQENGVWEVAGDMELIKTAQ
ncbi:hypothetical protein ACLH0K_08880 [Arthrobacter sp. MPF02]|uniref:hypothetical protein n=1 Tax=Arthrobacter sp. MPF02 TaxID=3388492 RepID=UPI0039852354